MLKQLATLRTEYKSLQFKLLTELTKRTPNKDRITKLKELLLRTRASMLSLLSKKNVSRELRQKRLTRRRNRQTASDLASGRYNFNF